MTQTPRFAVAMFLWLGPDGKAALARFRQNAAPILARHGVQVDRVLELRGKGQIVGENPHELPDMFQHVSFPDAAAFKAYVSDPEYLALAPDRDQALRRMLVMSGPSHDLGHLATPGTGAVTDRLYGVGLPSFKPGGADGLAAFNEQAQSLFARHGMHLEAMIDAAQTAAPIGDLAGFEAERVVVFFLDRAESLAGYARDPEYVALAPVRDAGLQSYPLFFGAVPVTAGGE
jgi:uncharacterized protein (DUF1330 family)